MQNKIQYYSQFTCMLQCQFIGIHAPKQVFDKVFPRKTQELSQYN